METTSVQVDVEKDSYFKIKQVFYFTAYRIIPGLPLCSLSLKEPTGESPVPHPNHTPTLSTYFFFLNDSLDREDQVGYHPTARSLTWVPS